MTKTLKEDRIRILIIVLILLLTAGDFFLRCISYIPVGDDVDYEYMQGVNNITDYDWKLGSVQDVVASQINHYQYVNGRAIIHTFIQLFAMCGDYKWYCLFAPVLLVLTLILFVNYTVPHLRRNPLVWLLASITWLCLYPTIGPYYSPIFGMNYLYPMALVAGFLLIWRYLRKSGRDLSLVANICLVIYGFVCGWSHEGYSIPLSGATFFFTLFNYKKLDRSQLSLFAALWIGTLVLFVAPGNFCRVAGGSVSFVTNIVLGLLMFFSIKIFWLLLLAVILAVAVGRFDFSRIIAVGKWDWVLLGLAIIFGLLAHSGPWSYNGIEFFSAILCFRFVGIFLSAKRFKPGLQRASFVVLFVLIAVQQSMVIKAHSEVYRSQLRMLDDYRKSSDVIVCEPDFDYPAFVKPYLPIWNPALDKTLMTLSIYGRPKDSEILLLSGKDWQAVADSASFFIPANKVSGDSPFYSGDRYYWALADEVRPDVERYEVNLLPVELAECPYFLIKLKKIVRPDSFWSSDFISADSMKTVSGEHPDIMMVPKTSWRSVKSINAL